MICGQPFPFLQRKLEAQGEGWGWITVVIYGVLSIDQVLVRFSLIKGLACGDYIMPTLQVVKWYHLWVAESSQAIRISVPVVPPQ